MGRTAVGAGDVPVTPGRMLPREHGAWGMLAVSFLSGLALARGLRWTSLAAAVAVWLLFTIREPLVVLGRQALVWRDRRAETKHAVHVAMRRAILLAGAGAMLAADLPLLYLALLGAAAAGGLIVAVWMTVRNRQRSLWLQVVSTLGLNASALVAWLSVRKELAPEIWWLWAALSAHAVGAVLVVHARLEARIHSRRAPEQAALPFRSSAWGAAGYQIALLCCAAAIGLAGRPVLAAALVLSGGWHLFDLTSFRNRHALETPLKRVGWRAMAVSIAFAALALGALV